MEVSSSGSSWAPHTRNLSWSSLFRIATSQAHRRPKHQRVFLLYVHAKRVRLTACTGMMVGFGSLRATHQLGLGRPGDRGKVARVPDADVDRVDREVLAAAREVVASRFPAIRSAILAESALGQRRSPKSDLDLVIIEDGAVSRWEGIHGGRWPVEMFISDLEGWERWVAKEVRHRRPLVMQTKCPRTPGSSQVSWSRNVRLNRLSPSVELPPTRKRPSHELTGIGRFSHLYSEIRFARGNGYQWGVLALAVATLLLRAACRQSTWAYRDLSQSILVHPLSGWSFMHTAHKRLLPEPSRLPHDEYALSAPRIPEDQ
jgi:hypothetical protein